jgi:predicted nuclease of predicted toxin-antitoxin system
MSPFTKDMLGHPLTVEEYDARYKELYPDLTEGSIEELLKKDILGIFNPFVGNILDYKFVGSRETCNPPPTDTDLDILVLTDTPDWLKVNLINCGFVSDLGYEKLDKRFESFRREEVNLIVTEDKDFFHRFCLAASLCKSLNVMDKQTRINIHNTIINAEPHTK